MGKEKEEKDKESSPPPPYTEAQESVPRTLDEKRRDSIRSQASESPDVGVSATADDDVHARINFEHLNTALLGLDTKAVRKAIGRITLAEMDEMEEFLKNMVLNPIQIFKSIDLIECSNSSISYIKMDELKKVKASQPHLYAKIWLILFIARIRSRIVRLLFELSICLFFDGNSNASSSGEPEILHFDDIIGVMPDHHLKRLRDEPQRREQRQAEVTSEIKTLIAIYDVLTQYNKKLTLTFNEWTTVGIQFSYRELNSQSAFEIYGLSKKLTYKDITDFLIAFSTQDKPPVYQKGEPLYYILQAPTVHDSWEIHGRSSQEQHSHESWLQKLCMVYLYRASEEIYLKQCQLRLALPLVAHAHSFFLATTSSLDEVYQLGKRINNKSAQTAKKVGKLVLSLFSDAFAGGDEERSSLIKIKKAFSKEKASSGSIYDRLHPKEPADLTKEVEYFQMAQHLELKWLKRTTSDPWKVLNDHEKDSKIVIRNMLSGLHHKA